jgi:hypothetical protein
MDVFAFAIHIFLWDVYGLLGFFSIQKCTSAMRMLAYGLVVDACDIVNWGN